MSIHRHIDYGQLTRLGRFYAVPQEVTLNVESDEECPYCAALTKNFGRIPKGYKAGKPVTTIMYLTKDNLP